MSDDVSPPDSPFHGFSAHEIPKPRIIKIEEIDSTDLDDLDTPPDSPRRAVSPEDALFHGFLESEIPQPILIKTEIIDGDEDDIQVVEVLQAKVVKAVVKTEGEETTEVQENMEVEDDYVGVEDVVEVEDDDDDIVFYGFAISEIPLPMIIKDEPEDITVEVATPERKLLNEDVTVETLKRKLSKSPTQLTSGPSKSPARKMAKISVISPELPVKSPKKSTAETLKSLITPGIEPWGKRNKTPQSPRTTEFAQSPSKTTTASLKSPTKSLAAISVSPEKTKSPIKRLTLPSFSPENVKSPPKNLPLRSISPEKAKSPMKSFAPTSISPEKPKSSMKSFTPTSISPEKPKSSMKSFAPTSISPEKAKSPMKSFVPTSISPEKPKSPIKTFAPAVVSPEKKKSPMKSFTPTSISPEKAKSPMKSFAPTSISPEKPKSPIKTFAPAVVSPEKNKSPMKSFPPTSTSPEKTALHTIKSPTKLAAESLTSLGTAVLLPPKSPRTNSSEILKSPTKNSGSPFQPKPSALGTAVVSSALVAAAAPSTLVAAVAPSTLVAAVAPSTLVAAVAPGTLEAAVAETLGAVTEPSEDAILPDTVNSIPFDDSIEETPQQHIVESKGSIIVRNETGYFDPSSSQSIEIHSSQTVQHSSETVQHSSQTVQHSSQTVQQSEESFEIDEGEEEEEYEIQEGGSMDNVLVLENEENVETTTIEIHEGEEEEGEEAILVMVDGDQGEVHFQKTEAGEVTAGHRPSPGKVRQGDLEQITIIETGEDHETVRTVKREEINTAERLPRNIQILDEHGTAILLMDKESESDEESDMEDREFTVIVDEDASDDDEINLERLGRIPLEDKNTFEGETIEDILAQFETEQKSKAVACPNCKKCFVSSHFLNIHVTNKSTLCDLCNTQCCTAANLRNHKNLDCDLSKRKRNIDLIAQETALLGRKPIEPEKYYNMPIDSSDEENEGGPRKPIRSVNDEKYECGICGQYVKILNSHMKFIHGVDGRSSGSKFKCPECGVLVNNLQKHKMYRHDPANKIIVNDDDIEVVRCKNQGCDSFFNNGEELAQHQKHEHSDQARLACGMGGCDAIFDSRGALRKHRSENHPELEEFKPVDLEPDDPDRDAELTVACPVCERKFKHKNTCTVHIKVHHLGWSKRKMYECPDCMKDFDNKKNLELHREAIHLGIRTICPLCEKPVTRLDLHVRMVHTELPEWPCPDCGKRFKRKFDLNRHRVTVHLGVRNFPCDLCGKRFADMKDMTRHKNAVHYGMKIKWNSKKHKEERKRKKELMEKRMHMRRSKLGGKGANYVEFMDTGHEGGATQYIEEEGHLVNVDQSVILDPVLQSQLSSEGGEPRVLIEADPDHTGSLRFVVLQEDMVDENGIEIEEEEETETHIILEPED